MESGAAIKLLRIDHYCEINRQYSIGNPTTYWVGYNDYYMSWTGRQLDSVNIMGMDNTTYTYNDAGIRTSKNRNGTVYSYILDGSKILKETRGASTTLYYYYDDAGSVTGFTYNGTNYYYGKNIQGDVKYIYNTSGTVVVEYCYDAWGNIISVTGSLASTIGVINPFRYRSYYYDSETGFYYLNSRYYDPQVGRFINADNVVGGNSNLSLNIFTYCSNNPVAFSDASGHIQAYTIVNDGGGSSTYHAKPCRDTGTTAPIITKEIPTIYSRHMDIIGTGFNLASDIFKAESISLAADATSHTTIVMTGYAVRMNVASQYGARQLGQSNKMVALSDTTRIVSKSIGYTLLVVDCTASVINNINNDDLTYQRKISDSVVDVAISAGTFWGSAAIGSAVGTAFCPLLGTLAGFGVGGVSYLITEYTPVVSWIKEGAGSVVYAMTSGGDYYDTTCRPEY
ncbi:MAG: hypothetical protein A2Y17_10260 [Clostridiales bacterium GWF2_38_85]|nr:MAG: hypothetical protein A2Y17_10260 [Clostridiales bacterium GWF2_38_85]HBL83291.1 hypothetical protein [Clostridiales bacterium]